MTPAEIARETASRIRTNPKRHDQIKWFNLPLEDEYIDVDMIGTCGTTACCAGEAALVATPAAAYVSRDGLYGVEDTAFGLSLIHISEPTRPY